MIGGKTMSVRMNFEHELETLRENMDAMGKGIQQAFADLLSAIALNDLEELDRIQKNDRKINEMERKIEAECLLLLTRQQPVLASDLRIVSSVMKAVGDMERIGDHAADIADMAVRLNGISYKEYAPSMPEMLEETRKILCDGVELFMARDKEQAKEFYKRYDMIDKKLDMVSYMLDYELLDNSQTDLLLTCFDRCIQNKYHYTKEQLLKMKEMINQVNSKRQIILTVEELFKQDKIKSDYSKEELSKKLLSTNKDKDVNKPSDITESFNRLENYWMLNDQCTYMLRTIPRLVKEKVIK